MFALRRRLRMALPGQGPVFWVGCLLFFLFAFGAVTVDTIQIGARGSVHVNAPFAIVQTLGILSLFADSASSWRWSPAP